MATAHGWKPFFLVRKRRETLLKEVIKLPAIFEDFNSCDDFNTRTKNQKAVTKVDGKIYPNKLTN